MKKSKIDPKDVLKDADKLLNLINNLEELNLENTDLDKFEEEIKTLEGEIKNKYKDYYNKEDIEDSLDTKE